MSGTMPLGGHAGPFKCGRLLRWPDESSRCPREATHHIIWTEDVDNTIDCDEHTAEARHHEPCAIHPYRMECSMPGAVFVHDENVCIVDEEGLGLTEADRAADPDLVAARRAETLNDQADRAHQHADTYGTQEGL